MQLSCELDPRRIRQFIVCCIRCLPLENQLIIVEPAIFIRVLKKLDSGRPLALFECDQAICSTSWTDRSVEINQTVTVTRAANCSNFGWHRTKLFFSTLALVLENAINAMHPLSLLYSKSHSCLLGEGL